MVHISKISDHRINRVEDVLTLGDKVKVICLGKDKMGRMSFSIKDVPGRSINMRYHNITKDDMLNGDGLRLFCGLPVAITAAGIARTRSPGIQMADLHLQKRRKPKYLQSWIKIISVGSPSQEVIHCIHRTFQQLLLLRKKSVKDIRQDNLAVYRLYMGRNSE